MLIWLGVGLVLLASAGITYAATQGASSGSGWVTQRGTFAVPAGQTVGDVLPLTGVTVSGRCVPPNPDPPWAVIPVAVLEAADGKTMDAFVSGSGPLGGPDDGTLGGTSVTKQVGYGSVTQSSYRALTIVAKSNDAIATVTIGGMGDFSSQTCMFMWQAVELIGSDSSPPGEPVPVSPGGVTGGGS
jgi:hypothetical protein